MGVTREEFSLLVKGMKAVYIQETFIVDKDAFDVWYELLKDLDYKILSVTIQKCMTTNKFPPTIADIREQYQSITQQESMSDMEAWALVSNALRRSSYYAQEEFDKLPSVIQKSVGSPNQLHIWATTEDYNESVISSQFLRVYRTEKERERQMKRIPANIRKIMQDNTMKQLELQE